MNDNFSLIVVDDDPSILQFLQSLSAMEELHCEVFSDAEQALVRLTQRPFDVMLADIIMPGMRDLELTERAKRICPEMNVIVMTGYIENFSFDDAAAAGAADFIRKPFSLNELILRIKHVRLQERLRTLTITDELTDLPNRRGFFALADQQLRASKRSQRQMVLLFADIDDFKKINDTWGHQTGDRALQAMANIFRRSIRESDIVARMGGDEFAVLLIDIPDDGLRAFRGRFERNIADFNAGQNGSFTLSASIGTAFFDSSNPRSIDDLMREADMLMYQEKQKKKERSGTL